MKLSRREALLGVLLAPVVKGVAAMLPGETDPRPWIPRWKEVLVHVKDPESYSFGQLVIYSRDPIDPLYYVQSVVADHHSGHMSCSGEDSGCGLLLLRRRNG